MTIFTTSTASPKLIISPVRVIEVHDADTMHISFPIHALWPDLPIASFAMRVAKVNAAELSTAAGKAAKVEVDEWLADHPPTELLVYGREKYGRLLADLDSSNGLLSAFVLSIGAKPMSIQEQVRP
jgi:hypothetical protein